MKNPKIIFMGTPEFAVPVLEGLIEHYDVVLVVTQPDKPVGRKQVLTPSPIKEIALANQIPFFQPEKIRNDYQRIEECDVDLIITCAYGQIIPEEVLRIPKIGCFNVHASLLPKYRGGAPIHKCLMNGDEKTGVTIMYMEKGMDTGDIISQAEYRIQSNDNVGTLHEVLAKMGRDLLLETLPSILAGTNKRQKQKEEDVTYAYNVKREEERLDFHKKGQDLINQIRGLNPWPLANFLVDKEEYKVLEAYFEKRNNSNPGEVHEVRKDAIGIDVCDGTLYLTRLKPFGKKVMDTKDFLNGTRKETILNWKINME